MREIKFRGKTTKGEWIYGSLINNCEGIKHKPQTNTKTWIVESAFGNGGWFNIRKRSYVKPDSVGQFTGYYDDHMNEIYEGDIVGAWICDCFIEMSVIFMDGRFTVNCEHSCTTRNLDDFDCLLVVGNTYDIGRKK